MADPMRGPRSALRGRWRRTIWLTGTCLALTGCTPLKEYLNNGFKVGPNYYTPDAAIAPKWIDEGDKRVISASQPPAEWWQTFNDPALTGLIQTAVQQNLTLREAGARVLQARAQLGIAEGDFFPQVQKADGGYTQTTLSTAVANRQFIADRYYAQTNLGFSLAWELDFWGRFRRAIEAADAQLEASVFDYDDVLVTLLGDVASTYALLRTQQQQLEYIRQNVALQKTSLDIAKARFQGGQTSELDADQAQSTLSQTEAAVPQLEIGIRQSANRLCLLLGIPPEDLVAKLGKGSIPTASTDVAVGIPADLLRRRPDVRRDERHAAAQSAKIGIADADFYPAVSLLGTVGWSAESAADLFSQSGFRGNVGPSFNWKLLNYGRIVNNVALEESRFQEAVLRYQNSVLKANSEVESALIEFLKAQEAAKYLQESVVAAEKAVKVAIAQYKGGLVDFNRVALLQQNLVDQQNQLAKTQGDIAQGLIKTYRALGGGWETRLGPDGCGVIQASSPCTPAVAVPAGATPVTPMPSETPTILPAGGVVNGGDGGKDGPLLQPE